MTTRINVLLVALAVFAAGLLSHPPVADAQSRYDVSRMGDVVILSDMQQYDGHSRLRIN